MQQTTTDTPSQADELLRVQVSAMRLESPDVLSMELSGVDGLELPPASPGAHVDVRLRDGLTRPYSVVRGDEGIYVLAVKREPSGQGGSAHVHERLRVGDVIRVSAPRNHFALADDTGPAVLIAGGIGITPLLPMARALERAGRSWRLHYAARGTAAAPSCASFDSWATGSAYTTARPPDGSTWPRSWRRRSPERISIAAVPRACWMPSPRRRGISIRRACIWNASAPPHRPRMRAASRSGSRRAIDACS
ncbi:ferredoxin reductase [Variovorax sp. UC122_21]|uniref:ferredoxin reductase n=1 Tax=Variovorax sp. UC122_21 TaxID=3374554 RepID=UPI0037568B02